MAVISKPWPRAMLAVTVAVLAFGAAIALTLQSGKQPTPAYGAEQISINPGNVPTTAEDFNPHQCDPNQGGGPFPGQDVWVFVLPDENSGDFLSITAHFLDENNVQHDVTITTATHPNQFNTGQPGTSKGWIFTPAGWTLIAAEAVITGDADFFNLTHTCPASESPSPSPSVSPSKSPSPSPSVSMSPSPSPSPSRTRSPRPSPSKPGYGYHEDERYFWSRAVFG